MFPLVVFVVLLNGKKYVPDVLSDDKFILSEFVAVPPNVVAVILLKNGLQLKLLLFCGFPCPVDELSEKFKKWLASTAVLTVFIVPVQSDWFNVFVVVPSVKIIVLLIFNVLLLGLWM